MHRGVDHGDHARVNALADWLVAALDRRPVAVDTEDMPPASRIRAISSGVIASTSGTAGVRTRREAS
jgi:hypothetical protein